MTEVTQLCLAVGMFVALVAGTIYTIFGIARDYRKQVKNAQELEGKLDLLSEKLQTVVSQKKSSEVRLGKIGENMAPFFSAWPYDPNKFKFLGDPVDGISFNEDEIVFVEIKTGKARLTTSQKRAKELIKEGKVKFATFRVSEDGCTLKIEED
jgi:predicted Holliday junction resolvase-like endonuclease